MSKSRYNKTSARNRVRNLAMACLALFILGVVNCRQEKAQDEAPRAIVISKKGEATRNGEPLRVGSIIKQGEKVVTGTDSWCEMSLKRPNGLMMLVRLGSNARYSISRADAQGAKYDVVLNRGRAHLDINNPGGQADIRVYMPTAIASVRGTKFSIAATSESSTAAVFEGRIRVRPRIPELERIPESVVDKSSVLKAARHALQQSGRDVASGSTLSVDKSVSAALLQSVPKLQATLRSPEVRAVMRNKNPGSDQIAAAVRVLDAGFDSDTARTAMGDRIRKALQKKMARPRTLDPDEAKREFEPFLKDGSGDKDAKDADLKTKKQVAKPPVAKKRTFRERIKQYKKLVADKKAGKGISKAVFKKKVTTIMGKAPETIKLKNGQTVYGVSYQRGNKYIIYTVDGERVYKLSDLAEVKF